jgi:hypothetical protein
METWSRGSIDVPVSNLSQGKWVAGNESTACEMPLYLTSLILPKPEMGDVEVSWCHCNMQCQT